MSGGRLRVILARMTPPGDRPGTLIIGSPIERSELFRLTAAHFEGMVKFVVDLERRRIAIGGQMHVDLEERLLADGSTKAHLWGANYYPGRGPEGCIEYTSLINVSPSRGNLSMEIKDPGLRERIRTIAFALIGSGQEDRWPPGTPG